MHPVRKELILKTINGDINLVETMHSLTRYRDCDRILKWLLRNNIKGSNLSDWIKINHSNSILNMVKFVVKCANNEREIKPIIYNKDWI